MKIFVSLMIAASCSTAVPDPEGVDLVTQDVVSARGPRADLLTSQRDVAASVADARLSDQTLPDGRLHASKTADAAAQGGEARELLSLLAACALPADVTVVATVGDSEVEISGELGLARHWVTRPLDSLERRWVSACAMARVSADDTATPVSLRGARAELRGDTDERAAFSREEGAFFGTIFEAGGVSACAGDDAPPAGRSCATEDSATPGRTPCGFAYAGACRDACARVGDHYAACEIGGRVSRDVVTVLLP